MIRRKAGGRRGVEGEGGLGRSIARRKVQGGMGARRQGARRRSQGDRRKELGARIMEQGAMGTKQNIASHRNAIEFIFAETKSKRSPNNIM